jgi:hypothetical protein
MIRDAPADEINGVKADNNECVAEVGRLRGGGWAAHQACAGQPVAATGSRHTHEVHNDYFFSESL